MGLVMGTRMMFDSDSTLTQPRYAGRHRKPLLLVRDVLPFGRSDQGLAAARPATDDSEPDQASVPDQASERGDTDAA